MTQPASSPLGKVRGRFEAVGQTVAAYGQRQWLRCLLLILFGVCARAPALQGELLWDDFYLTRDNPFIKSPLLIPEAFRHFLFPDAFAGHYRPVQTVSYVFDYLIWNVDAAGYHLSNLFWHIGSGLLLYLLLQRLLGAKGVRGGLERGAQAPRAVISSAAAFFVALLWMVHPVHSAAVDYISGRADSLVFFFACAAWLVYLRGRELERKAFRGICYALAATFGLLALGSRESGLIWLALFLLHLFVFDRKATLKARLAVLTCCLMVVAVYGGLRQLPEYRRGHDEPSGRAGVSRTVLMLRALGDYGRLMVWPGNLHMERDVVYGDSLRDNGQWRETIENEYLSITGLAVASILLAGAFRKGAARQVRILGAGWFVIAFLPISNLFELNARVAEHWLYLPSVGLLVFLAGCCLELSSQGRKIALLAACVAVVGLTGRSFVRSSDWVNEETFYKRTLLAGGNSVRMGVNLAAIYSAKGENARAESILRKVLAIDPDYPVARNNLATILSGRGKGAEAHEIFDAATRTTPEQRATFPRTWAAALNLAHIAYTGKDDARALEIIEQACRDYPGTWDLVSFRAELLRRTRGPEVALPIMEEFAGNHWWHAKSFIALGKLYCEKGDVAQAKSALSHASRLDVHDAEALSFLAGMSLRHGYLEEAVVAQRRAVARQPDQPQLHLLLSDILERMGRTADARASLAHATHLRSLAQPTATAN
jgi:tetratricopeptide (TPR) repeat protein